MSGFLPDRETQLKEEAARWDEAAAAGYDTPGEGMFEPGLLKATCDLLAELAGKGPALELGIGTGRVALPLLSRGLEVQGIDLSPDMLARLRRKPGGAGMPVYLGDMAETRLGERFTLVYIVFNTLSNLLTQEGQLACFENAARHLLPGGRFVVELWVPQLRSLPPGLDALVTRAEPGYFCVDTYEPLHQLVTSHHIRFGEGPKASIFRSRHRYAFPAELDLMARQTGFRLEARYADWNKAPFTAASASQIAVYQKIEEISG